MYIYKKNNGGRLGVDVTSSSEVFNYDTDTGVVAKDALKGQSRLEISIFGLLW